MYKICFYVPASHAETVKNSLFAEGAGKIGLYSHCAWQTLGEGQFIPLQGSQAFIGQKELLAKISEYKIEMVCEDAKLPAVIAALKKSHPYETPAYQVWRIEDI